MIKLLRKKTKKFHKFMKSGRMHKVCEAAGIVTYQRHVERYPAEARLQKQARA